MCNMHISRRRPAGGSACYDAFRARGIAVTSKKLTKAHISASLPHLHRSLIDIVSTMARPERDTAMLKQEKQQHEHTHKPQQVLVEQHNPNDKKEHTSRVGRDYSTVSRQVAR